MTLHLVKEYEIIYRTRKLIVSILTAFGMIIGVIVEIIIPRGSSTTTPPSPSERTGVKNG